MIIKGVVERITFHALETGYCVFKASVLNESDFVVVVGHAQRLYVGESFEADGAFVVDKVYGRQFKARSLSFVSPSTAEGILKYLGSGLIRGIGPKTAEKLFGHFGDKVFHVIETNPAMLSRVSGISGSKAQAIHVSWKESQHMKDVALFLAQHGISPNKIAHIYKAYGAHAIDVLKNNPYQLAADIRGIGFLSADKIARSLGIQEDFPQRIKAGLVYVLQKACEEGHCGLPRENLVQNASNLLNLSCGLINPFVESSVEEGDLISFMIKGESGISEGSYTPIHLSILPSLYRGEQSIVESISLLKKNPSVFSLDVPKAVHWIKSHLPMRLSASQEQALITCLFEKVALITGGPGVGKTTLIKCLLEIFFQKTRRIFLCAPTGRAAKRMAQSTGFKASTIHKMLEFSPYTNRFTYNEHNLLPADVVVLDEASMVDVLLMSSLLKALPRTCRLYCIGDKDQLPSVGPGQVLSDLIGSGHIPVVYLKEIFRQSHDSAIVLNAHRINQGKMPLLENHFSDFVFEEAENAQKALEIISGFLISGVQILSPMKGGPLGTKALNILAQSIINPHPSSKILIQGQSFGVGDPVIQTFNNYDKDIYNGDIGFIKKSEPGSVVVNFDGREVVFSVQEAESLDLAYALTIHKAQGCEFNTVLIPLTLAHYALLMRNLLYTGITRSKKKVILVGSKKAIAMALSNTSYSKRWTCLKYFFENTNTC